MKTRIAMSSVHMTRLFIIVILTLIASCTIITKSFAWESTIAYEKNGTLQYKTDQEGNRIPDFSCVGYKYGKSIPEITEIYSIKPIKGDNTKHIQAAIDYVGSLPQNADGIRGALLLEAGSYTTDNIIYIPYDGVIIRGSGSNTIIKSSRTGKDKCVFLLGNKDSTQDWITKVPKSQVEILDSVVPIGQTELTVSDPSPYNIGDPVVVMHSPKKEWFSAIKDGGTHGDPGWSTLGNDFSIRYIRYVTAISGNKITIDAPLYMRLDNSYASLTIFKYDSSQLKSRTFSSVGIENMQIDIATNSGSDENHTKSTVCFQGVVDGWAQGLTMRYFSYAGIDISRSTRITVQNCIAGPPISPILGGRRYNFCSSTGAQQILFTNCTATSARHGFVSNGTVSASGLVFYKCHLKNNIGGSEGHRWWTTGMLFDSCSVSGNGGFHANNLGSGGTSHGWGSANSVLWNISGSSSTTNIVHKPPTAQNYAIGVTNATGNGLYKEPRGWIEGLNQGSTLSPSSLYQAQLAERSNSSLDKKWECDVSPPDFWVTITNTPNPQLITDTLVSGTQLKVGQFLQSANGLYRFQLQEDGNLVIRNVLQSNVLWSSHTKGSGGNILQFQSSDGNIVLYKKIQDISSIAVWSSHTTNSGASKLKLKNDGSLILYDSDNTIIRTIYKN